MKNTSFVFTMLGYIRSMFPGRKAAPSKKCRAAVLNRCRDSVIPAKRTPCTPTASSKHALKLRDLSTSLSIEKWPQSPSTTRIFSVMLFRRLMTPFCLEAPTASAGRFRSLARGDSRQRQVEGLHLIFLLRNNRSSAASAKASQVALILRVRRQTGSYRIRLEAFGPPNSLKSESVFWDSSSA